MKKIIQKSHEEQTVEEYIPSIKDKAKNTTEKVEKQTKPKEELLRGSIEKTIKNNSSQEILKGSVEKVYKKIDKDSLETIEKIGEPLKRRGRKITPKKSATKSFGNKKAVAKKSTTKQVKFSPPKILLKKEGYELIITEKPQAALKIASSLGHSTQRNINKVPYYEVDRKGHKIIVACAVGHLFTLTQNVPGSIVPTFDIGWTPNYLARKNDFTKRYYDTLLKIAQNAGNLTVATDFDIEGEVIGLNVVRFICGQKDAERMKFSTLTEKELDYAYEHKLKTLEWGQAIAGETRHYLDWFYGINLSRALMNAIKTTGGFKIMSIGRVQGPTLNLIVQKEKEIQNFKSEKYFQSFITVDDKKNQLELKYHKDIFDKKELEKFKNLIGKEAIATTKKTESFLPPNPPFNLTNLQTEAYQLYGITPSNTLKAAQSLYLAGLISYPRTSSQKLPSSIDYQKILDILKIRYKVAKLITKDKPIEGKKTDPAHPSIYPTGNNQVLSGNDEKIYNLIVKRFLSLFCDDAIIDRKKIEAYVNDLAFSIHGSAIRKKAWMEIYPSKLKEVDVPDMEGKVKVIDQRIEEKETQPPNRYSPASIISTLEKKNLGTKATRSTIVETLYERGYIKEKSIEATPLGISLIETLEKYSPIIIDEKLTRSFEDEMEKIQKAKKDFLEKEKKIIDKAKDTITEISKHFEKHKEKIGSELMKANVKQREQQKKENILAPCPVCKKGNLAITYSKKTRRHFIACDAYPDCKTTYSLPPRGNIQKTDKICEECKFPILMALTTGKKPWFFCFNKECPTNKKRLEEYYQKKEEAEKESA